MTRTPPLSEFYSGPIRKALQVIEALPEKPSPRQVREAFEAVELATGVSSRLMMNGYAYEFTGRGQWKNAPDDDWEVVASAGRGKPKFLGFRAVDGTRCTVWSRGNKIYAQTEAAAPAPKGLR